MKYSPERREAILAKLEAPYNRTVSELATEEGISAATLYNWRKQARRTGRLLPNASTSTEGWSSRHKFNAVLETAALTEEELAEYCRRRGLYPEQIRRWRASCEQANERADLAAERQSESTKAERKRIRELERELRRKEAALAETAYYKPTKAAPKVKPELAEPIKAMIEESPSFGYRTVAYLLGMNKNTVQRIFQLKGWQVKKRAIGFRPRIQALPSVASAPNERWSTDLCRIWAGRDGWATLALVINCHTRELLGWHLSRSGKATTAGSALEHALIARFGTLGRVAEPFLLRSDNGLVFTSRSYTALVRSYGLRQEFITPHCPQQNGIVERVIRTLKEQCAHRHRFETLQHASRVIGDWIRFYNHRRPHKALNMKTPAEAFALAA